MNNKGFTLIELVVAIAILGVIMIMAVPAVNYIQRDNKDTKYRTYDKAINSAAKAYVDAYNEDLFGIDNTGCAVISYNDLKEKDLIEDIQVRNTDCGEEDTFVYVRKNKNENYHYSTNVTCRSGSKIIYGNGKKPEEAGSCGLEDNKGPLVSIIKNPDEDPYHIGDKPKVQVKLEEQGVGLKANQVLTYQWLKGTDAFTEPKTVEFKNNNFEDVIARSIEVPSNLEDIIEPVTYYLKLTGEVYDLNNNPTSVNLSEPFKYFVGAILIQMKAGGASMINPHHTNYKIDSSDYIYHGTDDRVISRIKYKSEADLWNYNNPDWINIGKTHYHMDSGKEWIYSGKEYDQATNYKVSDFGYENSDLIEKNITVTVTANWKINAYKLTYDNNGGSGCGSKTANYGTTWGTLCTPTRTGYRFTGWKSGSTTVTASTTVTGDLTVTAQWSPYVCTVTFDANGGTFNGNSRSTTANYDAYVDSSDPAYGLRDVSYYGGYKDWYHTDAGSAWKNGSTTYSQAATYKAQSICTSLGSGNQSVTLYANWQKNQLYTYYYTNGGKLVPGVRQVCAKTTPGCNSSKCSEQCNPTCKDATGCSGSVSGYVYGIGHVYDDDCWANNGIRDNKGTHATLRMKKNGDSGSGKWRVGSASSSTLLDENKKFAQVKDLASWLGKLNDFKRGNVSVYLYTKY